MNSLSGTYDGWKTNAPEAEFSGECQHPKCGNALGNEAYEVTLSSELVCTPTPQFPKHLEWKHVTAIYHPGCTREYIQECLDKAKDYQLDDWLPSIEKKKPCGDCQRFVCACP